MGRIELEDEDKGGCKGYPGVGMIVSQSMKKENPSGSVDGFE